MCDECEDTGYKEGWDGISLVCMGHGESPFPFVLAFGKIFKRGITLKEFNEEIGLNFRLVE